MSLRRRSAPHTLSFVQVPGFEDYLARCDLFSRCSPALQNELSRHFHFRHFNPGEVLIEEGQKATTLYVLLKGQVDVISDRYESVLAQLGPGMVFGEIGAIFGVKRTARVVTRSNGLVAVISRADLKAVLKDHRQIWNHIKGLAAARYRSMHKIKASDKVDLTEKETTLVKAPAFKNIPLEIISDLGVLAEAYIFSKDEVVDFFSGRSRHLMYIVKEGQVALHSAGDGDMRILTECDSFLNYDEEVDFAKAITDETMLLALEVEIAAPIFIQKDQEALGNALFHTSDLTRHIDANSSFSTAIAEHGPRDMAVIVNPAQFSIKRRNSAPVFNDQALFEQRPFVPELVPVDENILKTDSIDTETDEDLKDLLLNAGIVVPEEVSLLHQGRLNLSPLRNDLTDGLLLAIVAMTGSKLTTLNLTNCHRLSSRGVLAVWLHCPKLVRVSLQGCWNLDNLALATLGKSPCATTLQDLDLSHCSRITAKAFEDFNGTPLALTRLNLSYCKGLDDKTWPALMQFSKSLRHLQLRRCMGITDASFEAIFGMKFNALESVDLSECPFLTDASVTSLLGFAPNLKNLQLAFDTGIKGAFLIHVTDLSHLRTLNLSHITDRLDGSICSRISQVCPNLEELHLDGCTAMDDDSVRNMLANLVHLQRFSMQSCPQLDDSTVELISLKYEQ